MVFTDFLFANNKNMLLEIGYIIYFYNKASKANISDRFLIKCKRTKSCVLAANLYKIVYEYEIMIVIKTTIKKYSNLSFH